MQVQDWLGADNKIGIDIWEKKYRVGNETFDEWLDRVSGGDEDVKKLIIEKKFLFGGRILASRGAQNGEGEHKATYSNCLKGDTKIYTLDGLQTLESLVGKHVMVFSRDGWARATVQCFGEQPVKKLTLTSAYYDKPIEFTVTGDHIWFVVNDDGNIVEVKTDDLKPNMRLQDSDIIYEPVYEDFAPRWRVESVSDVIDTIKVYCVVEPRTQSFTLEGNILTHNCYVLPAPEDNLESIFDTAKGLARTFSYGGGVGFDLSKLSPAGARVRNAAKESSGAVSFMDLYSMVTGLISQHGEVICPIAQ